jgi:alanyl-tRNA synthetase
VSDTQEKDGNIYHKTDRALPIGATVCGRVDFAVRFDRMQNHSGEHIVSGLVHRHYGYDNVGFHLGDEEMTLDFSGPLTREQLDAVEDEANAAVFANLPITVSYPASEALASIDYRAKLALTEGVRLVTVEGIDVCACCAPHVRRTGEVGMIKLLDFMRYKGGVRVHMQCGFDALDDYNERCAQMRRVSMAISAKQCEIAEGVERLLEELIKHKVHLTALKQEIMTYKLERLEYTEASICIFDYTGDMLAARNFVNEAVTRTGRICALFCGNDEEGYKYIMASETVDLKANMAAINAAIGGKGGGSSRMIQGSCNAKKADIEAFFSKENF